MTPLLLTTVPEVGAHRWGNSTSDCPAAGDGRGLLRVQRSSHSVGPASQSYAAEPKLEQTLLLQPTFSAPPDPWQQTLAVGGRHWVSNPFSFPGSDSAPVPMETWAAATATWGPTLGMALALERPQEGQGHL